MVDWPRLRGIVQHDEQLLNEVLAAFLMDASNMTRNLDQAVLHNDLQRLRIAAHSISGSMRVLGCEHGRQVARQLEDAAAVGQLQHANELVQSIKGEIDAICREINGHFGR